MERSATLFHSGNYAAGARAARDALDDPRRAPTLLCSAGLHVNAAACLLSAGAARDAEEHLAAAERRLRLARPGRASSTLSECVRVERVLAARYNTALLHLQTGRVEEAVREASRACAFGAWHVPALRGARAGEACTSSSLSPPPPAKRQRGGDRGADGDALEGVEQRAAGDGARCVAEAQQPHLAHVPADDCDGLHGAFRVVAPQWARLVGVSGNEDGGEGGDDVAAALDALYELALFLLALYLQSGALRDAQAWHRVAISPMRRAMGEREAPEHRSRRQLLRALLQLYSGEHAAAAAADGITAEDGRALYVRGALRALHGDGASADAGAGDLERAAGAYRSEDAKRLLAYTRGISERATVPSSPARGACALFAARVRMARGDFGGALSLLHRVYAESVATGDAGDDILSLPCWSRMRSGAAAARPPATGAVEHAARATLSTMSRCTLSIGGHARPRRWHELPRREQRALIGLAMAEALAGDHQWDACLQVCQRLDAVPSPPPQSSSSSSSSWCFAASDAPAWALSLHLLRAEALLRASHFDASLRALPRLHSRAADAPQDSAAVLASARAALVAAEAHLRLDRTEKARRCLERVEKQVERCDARVLALVRNARALVALCNDEHVEQAVLPRFIGAYELMPHDTVAYNCALVRWARMRNAGEAVLAWLAHRQLDSDGQGARCDTAVARIDALRAGDTAAAAASAATVDAFAVMDGVCVERRREDIAELRILEEIARLDAAECAARSA